MQAAERNRVPNPIGSVTNFSRNRIMLPPHSKLLFDSQCCAPDLFLEPVAMMPPDAKVEKAISSPKPVAFRKSTDNNATERAIRHQC